MRGVVAVSGDPAKAHICLALGDRLCSDPETRRGLDKLRTEIETLAVDRQPAADIKGSIVILPSNQILIWGIKSTDTRRFYYQMIFTCIINSGMEDINFI